jgi:hypothetical protein
MPPDGERLLQQHLSAHRGFLPDRVRRSGRKAQRKTLEALGDGSGWAARLFTAGPGLQHVILALDDLGLPDLGDESDLYNSQAVARIKRASLEVFPGPFWLRLEVGYKLRHLHAHALAHELPRCPHIAKPVEDLERLLLYLHKAQVPSDLASARVFLVARQEARDTGKRLPRTVWWRGIRRG